MREQRAHWSIWQEDCTAQSLIFLDETGIKTNFIPQYGWSEKGKRCFDSAPGSWHTYSILSAIGYNSIIESILIDGAVNKPTFKYFMEDLLLPQLKRGNIIIMDNLSVHKNSFDLAKFKRRGIEIKYLPSYSPDLNPIEKVWSKVKTIIRKFCPRSFDEIWKAMNEAFWQITPSNLAGYYNSCGYFH